MSSTILSQPKCDVKMVTYQDEPKHYSQRLTISSMR
jgi:hypothetical protein